MKNILQRVVVPLEFSNVKISENLQFEFAKKLKAFLKLTVTHRLHVSHLDDDDQHLVQTLQQGSYSLM